jgi:hypothetical protein
MAEIVCSGDKCPYFLEFGDKLAKLRNFNSTDNFCYYDPKMQRAIKNLTPCQNQLIGFGRRKDLGKTSSG